jgi:tetraacyldisaccharide 4'-kinase
MRSAKQRSALQRWFINGWKQRGLQFCLLWPLSLLFGALAALRRGLYRVGLFKTGRVPTPVIVVGNVIAGGSGKTPVVIALVQHLLSQGLQVGVISRGHGRRSRDCREVRPNSPVSDVGDEPALIQRATAVPVFVAARRLEAAQLLLVCYPQTQVIISDDGLQHLGLARDLEICVFDDRGIGNGGLLPAGPLREPWPRAVDWVLHTGLKPAFAGFTAQRTLARYAVRVDRSRIELDRLVDVGAKPLLALAAIAKPEDFFAMLRAQGLVLAQTIALPDHDDFADWVASDHAAYTVICTEKDAVKLWHKQADALAVPLILTLEPDFLAQLDARLCALLTNRSQPTLSSGHGHKTS